MKNMIQKYKKGETPEILPISQGRNTLLRTELLQLEVGEALFLPNEDWKSKNSPFYVVARIKKTPGFLYEYGRKTDNSGWLFRRTK